MADAALSFSVEARELAAAAMKGRWVEYLVCTIGFTAACMSVASAIYRVPAGVFDGHSCAYYVSVVSVVSAGVVGLAEACAAVIWLSAGAADGPRQGQQQHQQRLARRCVLCASFLPLAFMAGVGGLRILVK